ncbi:PREDICTED: solute carrier family 12 member 3-like isoform X2 [Ceratotherium simum simum]|uniref:Solute carrier family 12 member 3-like isoform X2 n=1 Tax=Ceratotherium simum simum TaxID=73337 RepID=A0ABM1C8Z9_CERSS|nr:PREDICTED: solute carrier family 12 member 3-like isoform X2 [Ceratotherium simum simum]
MQGGLSLATQHQALVSLHRQPQTSFQSKQGWRTLDVYGLCENGGLTMLIPYVLTHTKKWARCPVRVFVSSPPEQLEEKHKEIHSLLRRFRLGFQHVTVLPELTGKPQETSQKAFEDLVAFHWLQKPPPKGDLESSSLNTPDPSGYISEQDLQGNQKQMEWHMCLHEVLWQYSQDAALIVMSLPVIPWSACPGALHMTWLEMLSRGLTCPIAFIHGKQQDLAVSDSGETELGRVAHNLGLKEP